MSSRIPFLDLPAINARHAAAFHDALARVQQSGQWILGAELGTFEQAFANYCGVAHAVGVGNGLDALELVLRAWNIGEGDEVVVPGHTFIATWLAVSAVGATIVPVDPDPRTYCIGVAQVEPVLTSRTKAIIPVHLYGRPAPAPELMELATQRGLLVLEDAAQAHGARSRGRRAGALGHAAAFSFYPAKNLGALGDGGMVTTDDPQLAEQVRQWRNYGSLRRYQHDRLGCNSRLDELQAAFLSAKLPHLDRDNERRAAVAQRYLSALADLPTLVLPPADSVDAQSVWHLFVVRHRQRDHLAAALAEAGIATQVHYPYAPHRQGAFGSTALSKAHLPVSDQLAREVMSLPIGPTISDLEVVTVIETLRKAVQGLGAGSA